MTGYRFSKFISVLCQPTTKKLPRHGCFSLNLAEFLEVVTQQSVCSHLILGKAYLWNLL